MLELIPPGLNIDSAGARAPAPAASVLTAVPRKSAAPLLDMKSKPRVYAHEPAGSIFTQSLCLRLQSKHFLDVRLANIQARPMTCMRRQPMDILYIALGLCFFALCWGFLSLCERL